MMKTANMMNLRKSRPTDPEDDDEPDDPEGLFPDPTDEGHSL